MKIYLKRSSEKPTSSIFYSSSDLPSQSSTRDNRRGRIVQPSSREQQRLFSSVGSSRFQHVHWGKYGIKPIWPDEISAREHHHHHHHQQQQKQQTERKSTKYSWPSFFSKASKNERIRRSFPKSDLQKRILLSPTSAISLVEQQFGSIWIFSCISIFFLLLLLLAYFLYRNQNIKNKQAKLKEFKRRQSIEDDLLSRPIDEDRSSAVRSLPTIKEELSPPASPSQPINPLVSLSPSLSSTGLINSPLITEKVDIDNDKSSIISLKKEQLSTTLIPSETENVTETVPTTKDEQLTNSTIRRRRSRFDQDSSNPTKDSTKADEPLVPPVVVRKTSITHQNVILDDFKSLEEVNKAVKQVGLVHSQLIFGIDYTISNLETGKHSFNGRSLHHIEDGLLNPYQSVITIVGRTLEKFDSDTLIPAFGFGDRSTLDRKIFPLRSDGSYCKGFRGVLEAYNTITPKVRMSGPTNFAPLIREAIRIVKKTREYHILVIVADGQVTNEKQTKDAIVEASSYPLSIVMIGVGDGPWDMMNEFDDSLPTRQFDNFQFVNYNSILQASKDSDSSFALHALMEIPSQYTAIKELGLLEQS